MINHTAKCDSCHKELESVVLEIEFEVSKINLTIFEISPYTTNKKINLCFECYNEHKKLFEKL